MNCCNNYLESANNSSDGRKWVKSGNGHFLMARTIELLAIGLMMLLALPAAEAASPGTFKHIIVMIQENRTPDNMFGSNPTFEPGVDIASSGLNSKGVTIPLAATPLDYCYDLGHAHVNFVNTYDGGKMDGADKVKAQTQSPTCVVPTTPQFKYVDNSTGMIQPYFDIATQYGFANRMFSSQQGPSFPGHHFLFTGTSAPDTTSPLFISENPTHVGGGCITAPGTTARVIDPFGSETSNPPIFPCVEHPTLTDMLDASNISWKYYTPLAGALLTTPDAINHICVPATVNGVLTCTGPDWTAGKVSIPQTKILTDITKCALPAVSWVIPTAADSDHAGGNKGYGPSWVASIINQVGSNPACAGTGEIYWNDTAILVTWDDWGGWYDHVPPYQIGQANGWGISYVYGMRVPLLIVSAYTPQGYVDNSNHDFGSILKFIETNNALPLIGPGTYADAYADDLAGFFSLTTPRSFVSIAAPLNAQHFLLHPAPLVNPDDD